MFNNLTNKFQSIFRSLTGKDHLTESNIKESMEEIRTALLDADVNYTVASTFVSQCSQECLGEKVLKDLQPGHQAVKIVYDKLVELLGENAEPLNLDGDPAIIMLCGLHGSGKTTTTAKLAKYIRDKTRKKVLLAACDVYRPAAIDQIEMLGAELNVPVYSDRELKDVPQLAQNAIDSARSQGIDVVIVDTAGRLQIDEELVQELVRVRNTIHPQEILLIGDGALGQEAVSVAEHFDKALGITGIILTKMDGDARGGSALSMHQVTHKPIKFLAVGERPQDLEMFHPDRMASRILGMGDILSLYERAAENIRDEEAKELEERFLKNKFGFDDFLKQLHTLKRMGGLSTMLKFLPGMNNLPEEFQGLAEKDMKRVEAMIQSMTPKERRDPDLLNTSRRLRIAKGCGMDMKFINQQIKQFTMMKNMMNKLAKSGLGNLFGGDKGDGGGLGGLFGGLGNLFGGGGGLGGLFGGNKTPSPSDLEDMAELAGLSPNGGRGARSSHAEQNQIANAAKQQKRLEQKKQAKKMRQKNRKR